ncbi:hypothetical protein J5N97_022345 [Dioscorea zingiberensis]|uniref:PUM-HD domain-containing protein n=1 Tax=Dioscorea zingiberensis TaxID=325984 RepID=A0A9D5HAX0_9LILI|nr:hypothetical protein J5N97_022345 [Dioscorea zingiberensis]
MDGCRRLFKALAISFSTMTLFTGITPLYGSSLQYAGPAPLVWGWVVVAFFTWFVGIAMAEICSSFPTTGSLYFWAAHLAGPVWGPFASWCCAWLETIGLIAGIGTQAYAGSQVLQSIILLCTGTNKGGGYLAPRGVFLAMYVGLTIIWAILNTFALNVIAFIDIISMWWQEILLLHEHLLKNGGLNDFIVELRSQGVVLYDVMGKVYTMAKDQIGCRFLQEKFTEGDPEDIEKIFCEIISYIVEIMIDPFRNYLVQKLLEVCNEDQRMCILCAVTGKTSELFRISCDMHRYALPICYDVLLLFMGMQVCLVNVTGE